MYHFPGVALTTPPNPGDTIQWNGTQWVPVPISGGGFGTQAAWFVNSATGNDNNDGLTAGTAIATLAELTRRIGYAVIEQNTTITLTGTFPEFLTLNCIVPQGFTLTIIGTTTTVFSGTIDAFTALNSGTSTPASIQDATLVAATQVQRKFVMTSGPATGAIAWGLLNTAADTIRISQFVDTAGAIDNPANTNTYDVETLDTTIQGYSLAFSGGGNVVVDSLNFGTLANDNVSAKCDGTINFVGCIYSANACNIFNINPCTHVSCQFLLDATFINSAPTLTGCAVFNDLVISRESHAIVGPAPTCFQTGGKLTVSASKLDVQINLGFFDPAAAGNDSALLVNQGGSVTAIAAAIAWTAGVVAQAFGVRVTSNSNINFVTAFTATGVTNDVNIGGTAAAYAGVPLINPANNASMVIAA